MSWLEEYSGVGSVAALGSWILVLPGPPPVPHAEATIHIRQMRIRAVVGEVEEEVGEEVEEEGEAFEMGEGFKINTIRQVKKWNRHKKQN